MTRPDPFASAPVQDEAQTAQPADQGSVWDSPPAEAPKAVVQNVVQKDGKVVLTFKGGSGFEAPWIVIHATDLEDALDQVSDEALADLMGRVQRAGQAFASQGPAKSQGGGNNRGTWQKRSNAPAQAQQPPAGSPAAPGPDWTYKSGAKKSGGTWQAWMPPQGSQEDPVWF